MPRQGILTLVTRSESIIMEVQLLAAQAKCLLEDASAQKSLRL